MQLETQLVFLHSDVVTQQLPTLVMIPDTATVTVEGGFTEVDSQVENNPGGAQPLTVKHPETLPQVQETELIHETLRVQRPALTVPGDPADQRPPAVQILRLGDGLPDLQVMAGNALVMDGGLLLPGGELSDPRGNGPPHTARAREVSGWSGVVDTASR